jgi:hypothetical protein
MSDDESGPITDFPVPTANSNLYIVVMRSSENG